MAKIKKKEGATGQPQLELVFLRYSVRCTSVRRYGSRPLPLFLFPLYNGMYEYDEAVVGNAIDDPLTDMSSPGKVLHSFRLELLDMD